MNKKLLCVISAILVALSLCFFASCDGCNGGGKTGELKSSMGVTLTGGNFGEKAKLITEKVEMTEENVKSTIDKLPEEYKLLANEKMTTIDISVGSVCTISEPKSCGASSFFSSQFLHLK